MTGFGYPPIKENVLWFGARCIYRQPTNRKEATYALDFVPGRYQYSSLDNMPLAKAMDEQIRKEVLPHLQELLPNIGPASTEYVELSFTANFRPNHKLILRGSPNGSCGYFYLSVSLVPTERDHND